MFRNNSLDIAGPRMQSIGNPPSSLSGATLLLNQLLNNAISNRNGVQSSNGGTQFGQSDTRIQQDGGFLELLLRRLSSSIANPSQIMSNKRTKNYAYASSLSCRNNGSGSGGRGSRWNVKFVEFIESEEGRWNWLQMKETNIMKANRLHFWI